MNFFVHDLPGFLYSPLLQRLKLLLHEFRRDFRVDFAAGSLHHLAHEPADDVGLTALVVGDRFRVDDPPKIAGRYTRVPSRLSG